MKYINEEYKHRLIKINYIICFILFTSALLLISGHKTSNFHFENSVFYSFSLELAALILISIIISTILFIINFNKKYFLSSLGLILSFLAIQVLLQIGPLSGYFFYSRGDGLIHIGFVRDIINNGIIGSSNFYPIIHILIFELSSLLQVDVFVIGSLISIIFSTIYFSGTYILSKLIFNSKLAATIVTAISIIPYVLLYSISIAPFAYSLLTLPFMFYLILMYCIENKPSYFIVLLCFIIFTVFFHILNAFYIIFILIVLVTSFKKFDSIIKLKNELPFNLIVIFSTITILWFSLTSLWSGSIINIFRWITDEVTNVPADQVVGMVANTQLDTLEIIIFGLKIYLSLIICVLFVIISTLHLLLKKPSKKVYGILFIEFSIICLTILLTFIIPTYVDYNRPLRFLILPFIFIFSSLVYLIVKKDKAGLATKLLSLLIVFTFLAGFVSYNGTGLNEFPTTQVTESEYWGLGWHIDHKRDGYLDLYQSNKFGFYTAIIGYSDALDRKDISPHGNDWYVGDHFNNTNETDDYYILTSLYDNYLFSDSLYNTNKFGDVDYIQLSIQQSQIYDNSDLKIKIN